MSELFFPVRWGCVIAALLLPHVTIVSVTVSLHRHPHHALDLHVPWGILIGGEELHNNHHAFTTSATLSNKWYEFDIGWMYIRILEALGLAKVNRVAPVPRFTAPNPIPELQTL